MGRRVPTRRPVMHTFSRLRTRAQAYVSAVVLLGFATVLHSIASLYTNPIEPGWLVLAALTLLTGSFTIKVPSITARLSVSETFVFASVLLFGRSAGTLTVVLETLVIQLWIRGEARSAYRAMFNIAAPAVSIWMSATIFFAISGIQPYSSNETPIAALFAPLAVLTIAYFLSNSWLVAIALGLERRQSAAEIWWKNFTWLSVNYFSGASVAAVIVTYTKRLDTAALVSTLVIIVPLLVVSYLTFRTAMGRVEDSNQHLSELNQLYLSTIETLAMAIDAKDQITHGHIRRVQIYAVGLARRIGVTDERMIKAIEAAALLHDMGKLAVPEYILNKPGKLTAAEFEKMKLHATVGADILSAIRFPYPVVPIVRHHHENWDGTGYPSGLRSTDIPIGARILSVVDCFDALTSDRPYRPRLSDDEALAILADRRGSMYDPLIVDTFVAVHREIAPDSVSAGQPRQALIEITGSIQSGSPEAGAGRFEEIAASSDEMLTLYDLARGLASHVDFVEAAEIIARHLRRLIPSTLCVFYVFDASKDEIDAKHAVGDGALLIRGIRMSLGTRVSGWVGANRQTICNSDPVLDLGDAARPHALALRSCLSTPIISGRDLVGVLALYSGEANGFNDDHRRVLEAVARQVSVTFKRVLDIESQHDDVLSGLPDVEQLNKLITVGADQSSGQAPHATLLLIEVVKIGQIAATHGRIVKEEVLGHVARHTRTALRVNDGLFRYRGDQFVALLRDADTTTEAAIAERIRRGVHENALASRNLTVAAEVTIIDVPISGDGRSIEELLGTALIKIRRSRAEPDRSVVH
jgi:diguanylate cyclase (GGDEF)-like protein/putative nucleotidyltransferase with HDIG domain